MNQITIHWFRQDLRLNDNPGLLEAIEGGIVIPVYILDNVTTNHRTLGAASKCWLHYSLISLNNSLNGQLLVYEGNPEDILNHLIKQYKVTAVTWNRCYEPWVIARDSQIKQDLLKRGITVNTFNGSLLWEPWQVLKKDKTPYRVFTPFYTNGCLQNIEPRIPKNISKQINYLFDIPQTSISDIEKLALYNVP